MLLHGAGVARGLWPVAELNQINTAAGQDG
jgi:hypothetical protein